MNPEYYGWKNNSCKNLNLLKDFYFIITGNDHLYFFIEFL